jgi:putative hydrolase
MTDIPFGFNLPGGGKGPDPNDPQFAAFLAQLQQILSTSSGPVNWDLARQVATGLAREGDRSLTATERTEVDDALRLADHWLDPITSLPSGVTSTAGWSRLEWIEATQPTWQRLCDPVAGKVVEAMGTLLPDTGADPAQLGPLAGLAGAGGLSGMLGGLGGMMFGGQVGQGLGTLSSEVLSSSDIGLPLGPAGVGALLPANLSSFTEGLERPADEVRLYVALREAAHHRLFGHVTWLRAHVLAAVDAYARGITVDGQAFEEAMQRFDPNDPESMQEALGGGMFEQEDTPEQRIALARLETALALVEGWVAHVVDTAGGDVPAAPGRRWSGRADLRHAGRPGAATAPATGGRDALVRAGRASWRRGAGRRLGPPRPDPRRRRPGRPQGLRPTRHQRRHPRPGRPLGTWRGRPCGGRFRRVMRHADWFGVSHHRASR